MEDITNLMEHWPTWLVLVVMCLWFIVQILDKIFGFVSKFSQRGGRREDDKEPEAVTHKDIYKELGRGTQIMEELAADVHKLRDDLSAHMQSDTNAQNAILESINQTRIEMRRGNT